MLELLGYESLDAFIDAVVPEEIRLRRPLALPPGRSEREVLQALRGIAGMNRVFRSYIGMGYAGCFTPQVIQRNVLENPGWYTAYTPVPGRDRAGPARGAAQLPDDGVGPDRARDRQRVAAGRGDRRRRGDEPEPGGELGEEPARCTWWTSAATRRPSRWCRPGPRPAGSRWWWATRPRSSSGRGWSAPWCSTPPPTARFRDFRPLCERAHAAGALVTAATDLLSLTLLTPPGEWGADVAVGNSQRFGVPMGYGGPHAAFFATKDAYKRFLPGRIIGVSKDRDGRPALRMALQTREQHIRRDKATSNVCTAQVLLAVMASMYAVYHGPSGLRRIAERVHTRTVLLANALRRLRYRVVHETRTSTPSASRSRAGRFPRLLDAARVRNINLRPLSPTRLCIALDETVTLGDVADLISIFSLNEALPFMLDDIGVKHERAIPPALTRTTSFLEHPVFHRHHSETEMLRYIKRLESRDLSLTSAMIPLGSCTMKLNATTEMMPVSWREFNRLHPFAPARPGGRLPAALQPAGVPAGRDHRLRRRLAAAERGLSGRVRRTAGDPGLSSLPRRHASDHLPDSPVGPRHQPGERRDGRHAGGSRSRAIPGATSTSTISGPRRRPTATRWRRS